MAVRLPRYLLHPADWRSIGRLWECRVRANIWVGANVLGFGGLVQFPLIRALSTPIGNQGIRQWRNSAKWEWLIAVAPAAYFRLS